MTESAPRDPDVGAGRPDDRTLDLLRRLLLLPPDVAAEVRDAVSRRRGRRPQTGPTADLG